MMVFDTEGTKRADHGQEVIVLAGMVSLILFILLYFNYLTTEMELIYTPESASSTASPSSMCAHIDEYPKMFRKLREEKWAD